jgi:hypothetical protein
MHIDKQERFTSSTPRVSGSKGGKRLFNSPSPVKEQNGVHDVRMHETLEEEADDDDSYVPSSCMNQTSDMDITDEDNEPVEEHFIVSKSCLWSLLNTCPKCNESCLVEEIKRMGTFVSVKRSCCLCNFSSRWDSQRLEKNIPTGNIALAAAIHFNGAQPTKVLRVMDSMRVPVFSYKTYWNYQTSYLQPTVMYTFNEAQEKIFSDLRNLTGSLQLAGDSRSDSPGHCAKYGCYSALESRLMKIVDFQLVQVFFCMYL